jgi:beta-glucuronidase
MGSQERVARARRRSVPFFGKGLRRRAALVAALACALASALPVAPAAAADLTRDVWYHDGHTGRWRIAGDWSFAADPLDVGASSGWATSVPPTARTVQVPYVWNGDLSGFDGSVAWYYARFRAPHPGLFRVRFLSTHHLATAFMDGVPVGTHEGGFLAWETAPVQLSAGDHLLAVRLDTRQQATIAQTGGRAWWNWGGISREVELREARAIDVSYVRAGTDSIAAHSAAERITVGVANTTGRTARGAVRITLAGRSLVSRPFTLPARGQREVTFRERIERAHLWAPGHPSLYPLDVFTGEGRARARAWTGHIGIRRLVVRHGLLYLNGERFFARGAALHDQARNVGAALTPADLRANLGILRGLHANFTRSHYPMHPGFVEMLDRAGIVLWAEAPVIWLSNAQLRDPTVHSTVLGYLRQTVDNQASHAAVGIWSGGNELAPSEEPGTGFLGYVDDARALVKSLDPSRPFGLAFEQRQPWEYGMFCDLVDVYGLNYYNGWYWGPPPGPAHQALVRKDLKDKISACPQRAWMITEFGAEAGFAGSATERGTYAYQSAFITSMLEAIRGVPRLNGVSVWAARDFAVAPGWTGGNDIDPDPPMNQKGLVTLQGTAKPAYYVTARWYAQLGRPVTAARAAGRASPRRSKRASTARRG